MSGGAPLALLPQKAGVPGGTVPFRYGEARGIFSFEKNAPVRGGEARLCRAGCTPHSLFLLRKREPSRGASLAPAGQFTFCAVHGGREKTLGMSWPPRSQLTQNEGPAATDCHASPEPTYRLRRNTPLIIGAFPHLKARRLSGRKPERLSAPAPCVPLRYALPGSTNEQKRQRKQEQRVSYLHPEALWACQHGVPGWTLCAPRPCHAGIGKSLSRTVKNRIPQTCARRKFG